MDLSFFHFSSIEITVITAIGFITSGIICYETKIKDMRLYIAIGLMFPYLYKLALFLYNK